MIRSQILYPAELRARNMKGFIPEPTDKFKGFYGV